MNLNDRPVLIERPAMTNTGRQRLFRQRNPGYYARLHATRRASAKRDAQKIMQAMQTAATASAAEALPAPTLHATAERREPLLLPAPVRQFGLLEQMALAKQRNAALTTTQAELPRAAIL